MKYLSHLICFVAYTASISLFGQALIGQKVEYIPVSEIDFEAKEFSVFYINSKNALEIFTEAAQVDYAGTSKQYNKIQLPDPEGNWIEFNIYNSGVMEEGLKRKFPEIAAIGGFNPEKTSVQIKAEASPYGFRAMITGMPQGTYFIDPVHFGQDSLYMVYYKKDFITSKSFDCHFNGNAYEPIDYELKTANSITIVQNIRREYRLAVTTTGEYSTFHGGNKSSVLAAIVTSINRVNSVYERDFSIRLILIENNDTLIFLNPQTDPFNNSNSSQMLSQNTGIINNLIGSSSYDIGHIFSTGGGGIAYLGCVCRNNKGGGVTGQSAPINDPFDIDYVAHEIGHQFGANHTQNNSCNRNGSTAYEPGSASTIMGYAGICPPNLQNNSDDHFHIGSIMEVRNFAMQGIGNNCANQITTGNTAPSVTAEERDLVIPQNTPFSLRSIAVDAEGDDITYNWEQFDVGPAGSPFNPVGNAPLFRSFSSTEDGERFFPRYINLRLGISITGELLPTYGRNMRFRVTARDNNPVGGANAYNEVLINVVPNTGPFQITRPAQNDVVRSSRFTLIEWDVAGTDVAPISCDEVDIWLSENDGIDFPYYLGRRQNNGSAIMGIPQKINTSQARIKIEGVNKIFFNLSPRFTLTDPLIGMDEWDALAEGILVYPNPGNGFLRIAFQFENQDPKEISIINLQGQVVKTASELNVQQSYSELEISTQDLPQGTYILRIQIGESTVFKRWLKGQ